MFTMTLSLPHGPTTTRSIVLPTIADLADLVRSYARSRGVSVKAVDWSVSRVSKGGR